MRSLIFIGSLLYSISINGQPLPSHDLWFKEIPKRWDEGLPMGNGLLGCLVWQKDGRLRLALDRADLWDERPMTGLDRPEFSYQWVATQVAKGEYGLVQEYFDAPYEREVGPTKIPGGALEFDLPASALKSAHLDISNGMTSLDLGEGSLFQCFVHAGKDEGWFRFEGFRAAMDAFQLLPPPFGNLPEKGNANSVQGSDLSKLGYPPSQVIQNQDEWFFQQAGWNGFKYEIAVAVRKIRPGTYEGVWSISSHFPGKKGAESARKTVRQAILRGFDASFEESKRWWDQYWSKSSISVPDTLIERQYYRDLYKFGCTAHENGPMISLQAIWTADNGRLPPWKGDLHHDLNTQMSYWPAYTSNHLAEGMSYLNHLQANEAAHRAYTLRYFGTPGLNVPGVSTYSGHEMGGWIQYSCSPTTSAWLAQHFYLQWQYSRDPEFLSGYAWPWLHETALHLEALTRPSGINKQRVLPLSSSPEIHDNALNAWFPHTWTNYDLALTRFVFEKTAELAAIIQMPEEGQKWKKAAAELPDYAREPGDELMFAPDLAYRESHRHFSHLMAIYPLGLLDYSREKDRSIIEHSLKLLDSVGPGAWCGYSYAWLANLRARARDGAGARDALRIFAAAFVSPNSFHLNGDQSGKGYSSFTYRPFTLEGNFAYAAGVQEMLLQSQNGVVRVFPAIPSDWGARVSFHHLRAEGAFLVSAEKDRFIEILAEQDGELSLELPSDAWEIQWPSYRKISIPDQRIFRFYLQKGDRVLCTAK